MRTYSIDDLRDLATKQRDTLRRKERIVRMTVLDVTGDELTSKGGKPYVQVTLKYATPAGEVREKKTAVFSTEAQLIIHKMDIGKTYDISQNRNDAGFWEFVGVEEVESE